MQIIDLNSNSLVRPVSHWPPVTFTPQTSGSSSSSSNLIKRPIFVLQPNKLYAIQCLVEHSRPRSQLNWFNGSVQMELANDEQLPLIMTNLQQDAAAAELSSSWLLQKYSQVQANERSSSSSVTRYIEHPSDETFRLVSRILNLDHLSNLCSPNYQQAS